MAEKSIKDRKYIPITREILETALNLNGKERAALLEAIARYSLDGELPKSFKLTGTPGLIWPMVRQQLDLGITKYLNGSKGGAPIGNQNARKEPERPAQSNVRKQTILTPEEREAYNRFTEQRREESERMRERGEPSRPVGAGNTRHTRGESVSTGDIVNALRDELKQAKINPKTS